MKFKVLTKKSILSNQDLIDNLNSAMDDPESKMLSSKYYEPNEMKALFKNTNKHFSFFHLNISPLPFHFQELSTLITKYNLNFDFLGLSESRLKLNKNSLTSIQSKYQDIILITLPLNVNIYKSRQLELTFMEVVQNKERIIKGCLYRHLSMELSEFNSHYLTDLLDSLSAKTKTIVLLRDFNADLLKYSKDCNVPHFLETMYLNLLLPHIAIPTRHLLTTLSDHYAQFLVMKFQTNGP